MLAEGLVALPLVILPPSYMNTPSPAKPVADPLILPRFTTV